MRGGGAVTISPPPPQPVGRFDPASGQWQLFAPWSIATRVGRLHLRPGYVSDGASIPRPLWPLVGPRYAADSFAAALAHDALYDAQLTRRALADAVLRDLLAALGMAAPRRWAYWAAVRVFGGPLWNAHSQARIEQARKYVALESVRQSASRPAPLIKAAARRLELCLLCGTFVKNGTGLTDGADAWPASDHSKHRYSSHLRRELRGGNSSRPGQTFFRVSEQAQRGAP